MIKPVVKKNLSENAKENLKQYIMNLDISASNKLPPEEQLASELAVSRVTVRSALKDLEVEGLILRIHGKGTFVNKEALQIKTNIGAMAEFSAVIRKNGYKPMTKLLMCEKEKADEDIAKLLHIGKDSQLYRIERMYFADKRPAIISVAWIPVYLFQELPQQAEWDENSNFDMLSQYAGKTVKHDIVDICAISNEIMLNELHYSGKPKDKQLLNCNSILCLTACAFDQSNIPCIYGKAYYNTDYIHLQLFRSQETGI